jgi:hypothetical protein
MREADLEFKKFGADERCPFLGHSISRVHWWCSVELLSDSFRCAELQIADWQELCKCRLGLRVNFTIK